jgi:N-acetylneuraminate synthase
MSGNHNQSLDRALALVDAAADAGAHALKIQTYTADTMTLDLAEGEFVVSDPKSLWAGRSLYRLYQEAHTPWDWHRPLFDRCRRRGLLGFSTPFDTTAVDFLETLDVPCYKIASFENTDLELVRRAAATRKPLFISTGLASADELRETVETARAAGCRDLVLLKCTSAYPAPPDDAHLRTLPDLRDRFGVHPGLSDHSPGIGVAVAAVALGAVAVEKHFTLRRADGGVDAAFSLEPAELAALVTETERAWRSLGEPRYGPTDADRGSLAFRRSLYVVRDLQAGDLFTRDNVRAIRPGFGLPPRELPAVLGRRAAVPLRRGTALRWPLIRPD